MSDTFLFCFFIFAFISVLVLDIYSTVLSFRAKKLYKDIEKQLLDTDQNSKGEDKKC